MPRISTLLTAIASLLVALSVSRCASTPAVQSVPVKAPQQLKPISVKEGESRPVEFRKLIVKLPKGKMIGAVQRGGSCVGQRQLTWKAGRGIVADEDFGEIFRDELLAAGYAVVGDPNQPFEEASEARAEYAIAGVIKDLSTNICYPRKAASRARGEASITVDWEVYSHHTRSVELAITTEGGAHLAISQEDASAEVILQAFQSASRNLLANPKFHDLIAGAGRPEHRGSPEQRPIPVAYEAARGMSPASAEAMVSEARMGVVTVLVGDALGSGFLISRDGYLLTNQHVVGKSRYVKARLITGREVYGEVVRVNRPRDVALVKLESDLYRYLPLGESSTVQPGSEVFAIGTPLDEELSQTVTKGIISGYGEENGQRMIRSDVGVHKGNSGGPLLDRSGAVVGIAVSGVMLMPEGLGVGLNSFIPIEDALGALGIRRGHGR